MHLVDIGANLTHSSFEPDLEEVLARAREAGVTRIIVTGTTPEESKRALDLSKTFGLYATAMVLPSSATNSTS